MTYILGIDGRCDESRRERKCSRRQKLASNMLDVSWLKGKKPDWGSADHKAWPNLETLSLNHLLSESEDCAIIPISLITLSLNQLQQSIATRLQAHPCLSKTSAINPLRQTLSLESTHGMFYTHGGTNDFEWLGMTSCDSWKESDALTQGQF